MRCRHDQWSTFRAQEKRLPNRRWRGGQWRPRQRRSSNSILAFAEPAWACCFVLLWADSRDSAPARSRFAKMLATAFCRLSCSDSSKNSCNSTQMLPGPLSIQVSPVWGMRHLVSRLLYHPQLLYNRPFVLPEFSRENFTPEVLDQSGEVTHVDRRLQVTLLLQAAVEVIDLLVVQNLPYRFACTLFGKCVEGNG